MPWMAIPRPAEAEDSGEQFQDSAIAPAQIAMSSPSRNDHRRRLNEPRDPVIVLGANRITGAPEARWVRRAQREEVDQNERSVAPIASKANASPNGGVIAPAISR